MHGDRSTVKPVQHVDIQFGINFASCMMLDVESAERTVALADMHMGTTGLRRPACSPAGHVQAEGISSKFIIYNESVIGCGLS